MKRREIGASRLWEQVNANDVTAEAARDLSHFRSSRVNFRIALWDPATNGVRYLKYLLFNSCRHLTQGQLRILDRVKNRGVGKPLTVFYRGRDVCLDYLQATLEFDFISSKVQLRGFDVLEIGAGYGRTAHVLLSNSLVRSYTIVDLDNCLELSKTYLHKVLTSRQYAKLRFFKVSDFSALSQARFDLAINIDSFAEMEPSTFRAYLRYIGTHCNSFYSKNPVGKFIDPSLYGARKKKLAKIARLMGPLRRVIDIFDQDAVMSQVPTFLEAYRPKGFRLCGNSWAGPWSYYWQALYRRS